MVGALVEAFSIRSMEESVDQPKAKKKRGSAYHCCVPGCNGDSRYHPPLCFHRIPGREQDKNLKVEWIVKIRRDEGPFFKVWTDHGYTFFFKKMFLPITTNIILPRGSKSFLELF